MYPHWQVLLYNVRLFEIRVPLFQGPTEPRNANSTVQITFPWFFKKFCPQCQMHLHFMFAYIHILLLPNCTTCNALNCRTVVVEYWLTLKKQRAVCLESYLFCRWKRPICPWTLVSMSLQYQHPVMFTGPA